MHFWARVASIDDAACVPESPSRQGRCSGYIAGIGLEEVVSICWIVVIRPSEES